MIRLLLSLVFGFTCLYSHGQEKHERSLHYYIVKTIWYIIHWNIIYKVLLLLRWVTNKKQILPNIKCLLIVFFCCFHIAFSFFSDAWLLFSLFCFHAFVTSCNYWLLTKRKILSHQDLLSWCLILRCFAFADIAIP